MIVIYLEELVNLRNPLSCYVFHRNNHNRATCFGLLGDGDQ